MQSLHVQGKLDRVLLAFKSGLHIAEHVCHHVLKRVVRLLTHVGYFSKTGSDTFRSALIYGKQQDSRKKFHNSAKNFPCLRRFDGRNTFCLDTKKNLIRKACFQMTLNDKTVTRG